MTSALGLRRRLEDVDSEKPQLVKTARQLANVDRVALADDGYREFTGVDGRHVTAVLETSDFRAAWGGIMDVMSVIAPVEETNSNTDEGVMLEAVASGSRRELRVQYCADGELRVKALWSASATVDRAMVVVDETFEL